MGLGDEDAPEGTLLSAENTVVKEAEADMFRMMQGAIEEEEWTKNAGVGVFRFTVELRDQTNSP